MLIELQMHFSCPYCEIEVSIKYNQKIEIKLLDIDPHPLN